MKLSGSILSAALLLVTSFAHAQTVCFTSGTDYTFAFSTNNIVTIEKGDFNNDGNLDIIGYAASTVARISFGNGSGGFTAPAAVTVATGSPNAITGIKAYDFNGDGNLDLAMSNLSGNKLCVVFGTGTGTFGAPVEIAAPAAAGPAGIDLGDFDEDGFMDVVVSISSGFCVFEGGPGGSFTLGSSFAGTAGANSKGIVTADFNNDGNLDVAVTNRNSNNVSVRLGDGTGGFSAFVNYACGTFPFFVRSGDINGDGKQDLVVANRDSDNMSVLIGNGDGTFNAPDNYASGDAAYCIIIQDFNGDSRKDVAVLNNGESTLSVLINSGVNTTGNRFNAQTKYIVTGASREFVEGDFEEDTHTDLVMMPSTGALGTIARGNGDGTFLLNSGVGTGTGPNSVAQGDFNGDGKNDLVVANKTSNNFSYLRGNGDGTYVAAVNFNTGTSPSGIAAIDLNHDGRLDVITANNGSNNISVFLGNGAGSFGAATTFNTANLPVALICKDFNNDTHIDIATANSTTNNISVLLGTGTGSFGTATNFASGGTNVSDITAGFFDAGTNLDIAVSNQSSDNVSVLLGTGTGTFGAATNFTAGDDPMGIAAGDMDGDGDWDIVTANNLGNNVSVLIASGTGTFAAPVNYATQNNPQDIVLADFNNDSDLDVATANKVITGGSSSVSVLVGTGTGTLGTAQHFATGMNSIALVPSLINSDPMADLAVANFQTNNLSILLNATAVITPSSTTSFCSGGSVDLVSTPANIHSWSNGATTQSITVSTSGTFTVTNSNLSGTCTSTSNSVTVTVSGTGPGTPTITGTTTLCVSGSTTLTATPSAPSVDIEWWTAPTGGTKVSENNSYTTPVLSSTTTYYVDVKDTVSGCFLPSRIAVTVNVGDAVFPVISGMPANISQPVVSGCNRTVSWTAPTVTDNCGMGTFTSTHAPGASFPVGVTTVTYTATDLAGNVTTASFTVTITDGINPTISGIPANISQPVVSGCSRTVSWTVPTANDNCSATLTTSHAPGSSFPVGTTTVTYTATDPAGNTATGSFTVTITDAIAPTIVGLPANITQPLVTGCTRAVSWTAPTATDNCGTPTLTTSHAPGFSFPVGTTTVTYTATDAASNVTTGSFTVTITDGVMPTIVGLPANITQPVVSGCSRTVSWTAPTATDNCGTPTLTTSHAPGSSFPVGTTTVTYTATDAASNVTTGSFTVTITDGIVPTIVGLPANISQPLVTGCTRAVSWTAPTATDNCGTPTLTTSHAPGFSFPVGTTTVTYTATDAASNVTTGSFTVTITDGVMPTIVGLPANITQPVVSGCSRTVSWTAPTATDNCGTPTLTTSHAPGSSFPVGTTTVTYTATDAASNVTTGTFTVTITDGIMPTISGTPANITLPLVTGCSRTVSWTAPTANDNCSVTLTSTHTPGASFPVGTTTVTYTATDAGGNVVTSSFTVTINDAIMPTLSGVPANMNVSTSAGSCTATVSWTPPTASDNCTVTLTSTHTPGSSFPIGTTTVIYTATDASSNTTTGSFTVTVADNINPTITGTPASIAQNTSSGSCNAIVTWTAPTATDNCGTPTLVASHAPGSSFPVGTTTVTYTATDGASNTTTTSFNVVITDNVDPVISGMPSNIVLPITATCDNIATWTSPTATDNCTLLSLSSTHNSGDVFPAGVTTVTYSAADVNGNITTASFTVTVEDNIDPTISGIPANITQNVGVGLCGSAVTWTVPTGNDNCSFTMTSTHNPGHVFPVGTTTVTYTVTDPSANTATGSFTVTVVDNINPVISGMPANISQGVTVGCTRAISWTPPTASDNCSVTLTSSHSPGASFPVGTTVVTYTATDPAGNVTTASFNVTVTDGILPNIPTITNISQNVISGCSKVVTYTLPTITDNCGIASITSSHPSGSTFPVGVTTVTITATDLSGNIRTRTFTITVVDNINPTISGMPANISVNTDPGVCTANVSWTAPTASDNCSATLTSTHTSGSAFATGTTTVTYTATDPAGRTATASFTVTVTDNVNPTLSGMPANISVNTDPGVCTANVSWTAPTATDNCSATLTSTHTSGSAFATGTTTVTYTATDPAGHTATASFTVTVTDNVNPSITSTANITVSNDPGVCGANVSWTAPTASDNCTVSSLTSSHNPGDLFATGTTTVTYTATDANGNISTSTFDVTVNDTAAPVISGTPADITVNTATGTCEAVVSWTDPTSTDNCSVTSFVASHGSGSTFNVGTTTVSYTAMDAAGNMTNASFDITVVDAQMPEFTSFPSNITLMTAAGTCDSIATWVMPVGFDNCGIDTIMTTDTSGSTFPVGVTTVTYTITDIHGNSFDQSFTVTVIDNELPVLSTCPSDTVMCEGTLFSFTAPTATDNCSGTATVTQTTGPASGTAFPVGITTVSFEAADASGNISTCSFNVTVHANPVVSFDPGVDTTCVNYAAITLSGGTPTGGIYSGTGVSAGIFSQGVAGVGTHIITYTVTDLNSCTASAVDSITVDECLSINQPEDISHLVNIYPNPSQGMFVIDLQTLPLGETATVQVYNHQGKLVHASSTNATRMDLDMLEQANGIYVIRVLYAGHTASKQVVLQR